MEVPLDTWLKGENINGTLEVEFLDEGEITTGEYGEQFTITVGIDNVGSRKWSPNKTSRQAIVDQLGSTDSKDWIGKRVTLYTQKEMVSGKQRRVIYVAEPRG